MSVELLTEQPRPEARSDAPTVQVGDPVRPLTRRSSGPPISLGCRTSVCFLLLAYLCVGFAYVWPFAADEGTGLVGQAAWFAFMVRTFIFHAGLGLLGVMAWWLLRGCRKRALAAVPLAVWSVGPDLGGYWPIRPAGVQQPVRVFSANLLASNKSVSALLGDIQRFDPDLILLQEYTPSGHAALSSGLSAWPYRHLAMEEGCFGGAIYSRLPLNPLPAAAEVMNPGRSLSLQQATVRMAGHSVLICNVHLYPPPTAATAALGRRELSRLLEQINRTPGPLLIAGDFNFTPRSSNYGQLIEVGFREVHALAGRGRGSTWPSDFRMIPGLRIDHIFLSEGLDCISSAVGQPFGSDHCPIMATIGFAR